MGCSTGSPRRKITCNPGLSQETRKIPNTKSNSTPKEIEAEQQRHPNPSRREIIKIRAEINNVESKKKPEARINETKSWIFEKISKIDNSQPDFSKRKERRPK